MCKKNNEEESCIENNEPCEVLLKRASITCKARYHAAERLKTHGFLSQWTLTTLAIGQIVITLIVALGMNTNFDPKYINFGSIFFGVLVLSYSLLIGMANFLARSVNLHKNGLELGRLVRKLYAETNSCITTGKYKDYSEEYYNILDKYENHTRLDYLSACYEYYSGKLDSFNRGRFNWWIYKLKILFYKTMQFSHYIISVFLVSAWIFYLVK